MRSKRVAVLPEEFHHTHYLYTVLSGPALVPRRTGTLKRDMLNQVQEEIFLQECLKDTFHLDWNMDIETLEKDLVQWPLSNSSRPST